MVGSVPDVPARPVPLASEHYSALSLPQMVAVHKLWSNGGNWDGEPWRVGEETWRALDRKGLVVAEATAAPPKRIARVTITAAGLACVAAFMIGRSGLLRGAVP